MWQCLQCSFYGNVAGGTFDLDTGINSQEGDELCLAE
jgi:hypothetical protein